MSSYPKRGSKLKTHCMEISFSSGKPEKDFQIRGKTSPLLVFPPENSKIRGLFSNSTCWNDNKQIPCAPQPHSCRKSWNHPYDCIYLRKDIAASWLLKWQHCNISPVLSWSSAHLGSDSWGVCPWGASLMVGRQIVIPIGNSHLEFCYNKWKLSMDICSSFLSIHSYPWGKRRICPDC